MSARLRVESKWLSPTAADALDTDWILGFADARDPLVWLREGAQAVGIGQALVLRAQGADRFAQLGRQWQEVVDATSVHDQVRVPGSGLLAFGTVAFADDSAAESLLIVPEITVQRHGDDFFLTICGVDPAAVGAPEAAELPVGETAIAASAPTSQHAALPVRTPLNPAIWPGCRLDPQPDAAQTAAYGEAATRILAEIAAGRIDKAVLARQIHGTLAATADLRVPLARLAAEYADCSVFAVDGLVGASPETLARSVHGTLTTRVLAGTAERHPHDPVADRAAKQQLIDSPQLTAEHDYAAESVVTALLPLVSELNTNTDPLVVQLPNVWHRATDISARVAGDTSSLQLVAAMHPTAAVAGTPTPDAVRLLGELEGFDRGRYAGAVGWISASGDGEWALALRCAQISPVGEDSAVGEDQPTERTVTATAGGGLVAGSEIPAELAETVAKFAPIVSAFA